MLSLYKNYFGYEDDMTDIMCFVLEPLSERPKQDILIEKYCPCWYKDILFHFETDAGKALAVNFEVDVRF